MGNFNTKVDFSNQIKEYPNTEGTLSGSVNVQQYTILGTDYSDLPLGLDYSTTGVTYYNIGFGSGSFTGTTGSTTFYFSDPNMDLGIPYLSAITPSNSGLTQNISVTQSIYNTTVDGNYFDIYFSGVTYDITSTIFVEYSSGLYSGNLYTNLLTYISGSTYPWWFLKSGSTTWNEVKGRLQTDRITITESATTGYVLTCVDSSGNSTWQPSSGNVFTGNTSATCITDLYVSNINSCSPLHIQNFSSGDVYIGENGNIDVGIGMSSPTQKLHVSGNTRSERNFDGDVSIIAVNTNVGGSNSRGVIAASAIADSSGRTLSGLFAVSGYNTATPGFGDGGTGYLKNALTITVAGNNPRGDINIGTRNPGKFLRFFAEDGTPTVGDFDATTLRGSLNSSGYWGFGTNLTGQTATVQIGDNINPATFRFVDGNQQDGYVLTSDSNGNATWQESSTTTFFTDDITTGTTDTNGYRILYPFTATTSGDYIFDATTRVAIGGASPTGNITTRAVVNGTPVTSNYRSTQTSGEEITHTEKKKLTLSAGDTFHYGVVSPTTDVLDGSMIIYKIS